MTTIRLLPAAVLAASLSVSETVQALPAVAAPMPMSGATLPQDCAKPMARHHHGKVHKAMLRAAPPPLPIAKGSIR